MSAANVVAFEKPKKTVIKKKRKPSHRAALGMSVVEQVHRTFAKDHRLSAFMGFILGGFVPVSIYILVHMEVSKYPELWVMVVGGLLYSAVSVYKWSKQAFHMTAKAVGFVVLVEGTVTFSHTHWLSLAGLLVLVSINGISAAVALQAKAPSVA